MGADPKDAQRWQRAFGERVRQQRLARGLSQMELAHKVGLHPTYISGIERGIRNVSVVNIHVLAQGLDVSPQALFRE